MLQDTEAPFSQGILLPYPSEEKKLLRIPYSKRLVILLSLEIFTFFVTARPYEQTSIIYVLCLCFSNTQFLLYHLQENFRVMGGRTATTIFYCDRGKCNCVF